MTRLALADFRVWPATHVVSLGPRCATAYNLRRYFGFGDAFPFDWWITPHAGLLALLREPRVESLYDPDRLEAVQDHATVRHRDLGILLHHEFPREARAAGEPVVAGWKGLLEAPRRRSAYLLDKLLKLDRPGHRIAFCRETCGREDPEQIAECLQPLFLAADWTLFTIPAVPLRSPADWQGDPRRWDSAFGAFALSLSRRSVKPFKATDPDADSRAGTESHRLAA